MIVAVGQKPRAPDTIKGFELTPMPPLLTREGDQGGELVGQEAPCSRRYSNPP